MTNIGIIGVPGRMACRVVALAREHHLGVSAALCRPGAPVVGKDVGEVCGLPPLGVTCEPFSQAAFARADVWIEFASQPVTLLSAEACAVAKKPLLVCTTGHEEAVIARLRELSATIPILLAPNTSLGVAVLNAAVRMALRALGPSYAAEVMEIHHDKKKDAPSGTAMRLVETIKQERHASSDDVVTGRQGLSPRKPQDIGVFALRGGNVIGEHTVYLFGDNDRLELTHRAQNRDLFADGALRAASFLVNQKPGCYTMEHALGLS